MASEGGAVGLTWEDTYVAGLIDYIRNVELNEKNYMNDPFIFACFETAAKGMADWLKAHREVIMRYGIDIDGEQFISELSVNMFYDSGKIGDLGTLLEEYVTEADNVIGANWYDAIILISRLARSPIKQATE